MVELELCQPAKALLRLVTPAGSVPLGVAATFDGSFHRITIHAAGVLGTTGSETDLIPAQPAVGDGCGNIAGPEGAGNHLKGLLKRKLPFR